MCFTLLCVSLPAQAGGVVRASRQAWSGAQDGGNFAKHITVTRPSRKLLTAPRCSTNNCISCAVVASASKLRYGKW